MPNGCAGLATSTIDGFDHRQVEAGRHPIVEQPDIAQHALGVVEVFLVERPSEALRGATLHLAFDVAGMNRLAGVLRNGARRTCTLPVSGSTSTSTSVAAKAGPTLRALMRARVPMTGPPVRASLRASCFTVIGLMPSPSALNSAVVEFDFLGLLLPDLGGALLQLTHASCAAS